MQHFCKRDLKTIVSNIYINVACKKCGLIHKNAI